MTADARDRLLILGVLWGFLLAAVPALVMTDPYELTGFLVVALLCAAVGGAGTFVAGRRGLRRATGLKSTRGASAFRGVTPGAVRVLVAGVLAALLFWVTMYGFTLQNSVELSVLMSQGIFLGSFFVVLSAFAYTLVGEFLLGPLFGPLAERAASKEKELVR